MRCPRCEANNPEDLQCCGECGTPLTAPCPTCGVANPPPFKFCGACGTPLSGQPRVAQATATDEPRQSQETQAPRVTPPVAARPRPEAERRQLTVLFCDLVDSTVLASQLDLEEWHEVVRSYQAMCAEVVQRYEGHIAQYLGDGLLIYFGYPQAHEDDAQRAVRVGLAIVEAIGTLQRRLKQEQGVGLAVRVGIHTGLVVEAALAPYDVSLPEVVPLLASLLSLPLADRYAPLQLMPQRQKQKTLEVILALLRAHAARQPVLFIVEDLHWIDPSTLELLALLIDQAPTARILTLLTCRPEFQPPWDVAKHVSALALGRLPPTQVELIIDGVTGGKACQLRSASRW